MLTTWYDRVFWLAPPLQSPGRVAGNTAGCFEGETPVNAADTKNASPLFSSVLRNHGRGMAVAGALLIAAYVGVASVLIDDYQRPDVSIVMAGG